MKYRILAIIIVLSSLIPESSAQSKSNLTYFSMPVQVEDDDVPSVAYLSVFYRIHKSVSLLTYTGDDPNIQFLSRLIISLQNKQQSDYLKLSLKKDTSLQGSYEFYSTFIPNSKNPVLLCEAEVGIYKIFYVRLEENYPLMAFCIRNQGAELLNNPVILEHPAIVALNDAINKAYLYPSLFKRGAKQPPNTNISIHYDSLWEDPAKPLTFYMKVEPLHYNSKNSIDSQNYYAAIYKPYLDFYSNTLNQLNAGDMDTYLNSLSLPSRERLSGALKESGEYGKNYYIRYKNSFNIVKRIIDLGQVKLLLAENPEYTSKMYMKKIYILGGKEMKIVNENFEFYFDDLIRLPEFRNAIFNP